MAGPTTTTPALWLKDANTSYSAGVWTDASGNGRDTSQATSGNRPTVSGTSLSFDGSNDYLDNAYTAVPLTQFYVLTQDASPSQTNPAIAGGGSASGNGWSYLVRTRSGDYTADGFTLQAACRVTNLSNSTLGVSPSDGQCVTPESLATKYVLCVRITADAAGGWVELYVNGAMVAQTKIAGTPYASNSTAVIGGFLFSGSVAGNSYYKGLLHEALQYGSALTDAELDAVNDYLLTRHSVTPWRGARGRYVFAQFRGDPSTQCLSVLTSDDLSGFISLRSTYYPTDTYVRDPGVVRYQGSKYLLHSTTAYSASGSPYPFTATSSLGVARASADLTSWTPLPDCDFSSVGTLAYCWGNKWFLDANGDLYANAACFLAASPSNSKLYRRRAVDLAAGTYDAAAEIVVTGRDADVSGCHTVRLGSTYHLFLSGISGGGIDRATASSVNGTYTLAGTGDWAGWRASLQSQLGLGSPPKIEGTDAVLLPDGATYRLFFDAYSPGRYGLWYSDSTDLVTWSAPARVLPPWPQATRNGGVILAPPATAGPLPLVGGGVINSGIINGGLVY